ncbi:MAG: hypothetical protein R3C11_17820 [Planctomycetaceae bacterium]
MYLIPPKANMSYSDGKLLLFEQASDGRLRHPIDIFFISLATEAGSAGCAVVRPEQAAMVQTELGSSP